MRQAAVALPLVLVTIALAGCLGPADLVQQAGGLVQRILPGPAMPKFGAEVPVDTDLGGSEPSLAVDGEGRVFVAAPTGLATPVSSGNPQDLRGSGAFWRSEDGGKSFGLLDPVVLGLYGPGIGGGDSDIATDADGNLYAIDLWLGDVSFLSSQDHGATWLRGAPVSFLTPVDDRQWIDVDQNTGEVYVVTNNLPTGLWVIHSNDGGLTWVPQTLAVSQQERNCICPPGVLAVEENTGNVYLPYTIGGGGIGLATSTDHGGSFTNQVIEPLKGASGNFPVLVHDLAGNLYIVAEKDLGQGNTRIVMARSRDAGKTWDGPFTVQDIAAGAQIFPWAVAGSAGRLAVAWYELAQDTEGKRWDVKLALATDALALAPSFGVVQLNQEPVLRGDYDRGALGDFFELAMGPDGSIHAVWNALPQGASRQAIFYAHETGGEGLLAGVALQPDLAPAAPSPRGPALPGVPPG